MPSQKEACFDKNVLHQFLNEKLDKGEESQVQSHIGSCKECRNALEGLAGNETVWTEIQDHLAEHSLEDATDEDTMKDQKRALRAVKGMLAPTDHPEMMGRIGPYEVCGVIGRGSSGIVVKALDPRLNRNVAIKLLAPVYSNIGSSRRRFEREGRAVASLNNPHVIPIHAVQDFQGTPYIVMQYLPDGSLQQRIDRTGPLSNREIVCVGMQIANGLAAAHAAGIVHRDVKPANVLLESGVDSAMVTDFGLARVVDEATMTHSGSISGTPQYMSPEQARGESVDPRSDLFSLGSVMYAACTGHAPFRAKTVFGVIKRVCDNEPRSIREMNPDIAEWLAAFIEKLNAKKPGDRFQSAAEVSELLHRELAHMQSPTMIPQPDRSWWQQAKRAPVVVAEPKPTMKPVKASRSTSAWKYIASGVALLCIAGIAAFMIPTFMGDSEQPVSNLTFLSNGDGASFLAFTMQENEKLPRFDNVIESTIDVRPGEDLFFRTNLGTLNITTHDKPTVEMKLKHTVAAKDKETAAKIFKALKMSYEVDGEDAEGGFDKGKDAVIVAKFPTQKLTQDEIEAIAEIEDLKEALLVRNNSHYRNAIFELVVPKTFNLDVETSAGPITSTDIDGSVKLMTHGGEIDIANVTGTAELKSHGGHIDLGNVGDDTSIETHGGHIVVMDVEGEFFANTHGGHISAGRINGPSEATTHGGKIEFFEATGPVKAESRGGSVRILKAHKAVDAMAHAGRVEVNFIEQPEGESRLTSHAGSVAVGYTEGIGFSIDASSMNGRISGPFLAKKVKNSLKHQLNGGTAKLQISSNNGSVKFKLVDENELEKELNEDRKRSAAQKAFEKAYELHMEGKIDEAIIAHQTAAEYESQRVLATYNLGCAYALKGKTEKAFKALNKAIDFGMDDIGQFEGDGDLDSIRKDARYQELITRMKAKRIEQEQSRAERREIMKMVSKGHSLFNRKDFEEAELHFKTVLQIEPENEEAAFMLGSSIHALGRLDEAHELHKLVANSKNSVFAGKGNYNIACVQALRGDTDEAIKSLRKAIKVGYHNIKHMKHDDDLKSIRDDDRFDDLIDMVEDIIEEGADDIADDGDCEGINVDCNCEAETSDF